MALQPDIFDETAIEALFPILFQDVLPIALERLEADDPAPRAGIEPFYGADSEPLRPDEAAADGVSEIVWRKLVAIERKLDVLMEWMLHRSGSSISLEDLPVVINEHGIRIRTRTDIALLQRWRMRIRIPVLPPAYILVSGIVRFVREEENGLRDVAMEWVEMDDTVLRLIRFYAMNRQREVIRKRKTERE